MTKRILCTVLALVLCFSLAISVSAETTPTAFVIDEVGYLVDAFVIPVTPLCAVDRTEVALAVGPFVPYAYFVIVQIFYVGISVDEPEKLMYDRAEVYFLCC